MEAWWSSSFAWEARGADEIWLALARLAGGISVTDDPPHTKVFSTTSYWKKNVSNRKTSTQFIRAFEPLRLDADGNVVFSKRLIGRLSGLESPKPQHFNELE